MTRPYPTPAERPDYATRAGKLLNHEAKMILFDTDRDFASRAQAMEEHAQIMIGKALLEHMTEAPAGARFEISLKRETTDETAAHFPYRRFRHSLYIFPMDEPEKTP